MSLFGIGDTHLSFGKNKPMDIFSGWDSYVERLEKQWNGVIDDDDTVVINGDISWSMRSTPCPGILSRSWPKRETASRWTAGSRRPWSG